ncbi:MAG: tetraacyldisaccharide 4'-kinase [Arenicella sp.]
MKTYLRDTIFSGWSEPNWLTYLLLPLTLLYKVLMFCRFKVYRWGFLARYRARVPVIVVGNISVGGTGKTPLTMALIELLRKKGFSPGVISRGYGGKALDWPQIVDEKSNPHYIGDEAVLIAKRLHCPVVVGPDRGKTADLLLERFDCDVIVSDDGLQHYALRRDIEIAMVDSQRRHLNQFCLPSGPLREPVSRLRKVDMVVFHTSPKRGQTKTVVASNSAFPSDGPIASLWLEHQPIVSMVGNKVLNQEMKVHAVAGIGHPQRFFRQLQELGFELIEHPFPDHHHFVADDFDYDDDFPIIMTEKDAVKCTAFATERFYFLPVQARLNDVAEAKLSRLIDEKVKR